MVAEDLAGVVRHAIEAIWNRGELDAADAVFAPGYVNHGGLVPDLVRGPEAIKISAALYRTAFPDLRVAVRDLRVDGETVVLRWAAHGTSSGAPAGGTPTGPPGRVTGVTRGRLVDGKIVASWTLWDRLGAMRRLGLIAP